ncbi:class I SAM-dependent methyltransferase [Mycolicibacterium lacusdiani]|jgi:SAM-dependent methyltransferase|uniref:methyltransferase domain-containing protein n=1 Tax=Mycolicibacterium lacusdiani TaxID=2895283 RepID=UPI001F2A2A4F|nr:class I SAM-dependent methyltransferase [Mycolicibacterium lacusdiani]
MPARGEEIIVAAVRLLMPGRHDARIKRQAARYWSASDGDQSWNSNSHWRNGIGDEAFAEVGRDHWEIYQRFARALEVDTATTIIEWGAGGGANAVAFAPHVERFIAADVSPDNLAECSRQVQAVCNTLVDTLLIDLADPNAAADGLRHACDLFLCLYVIELTTGVDAVRTILRIAQRVLRPGGMALVQVKYHTSDGHTRGRIGLAYARNLALNTTFTIEGFWTLAGECGLEPQLATLVPRNRLDSRYAYYALIKPANGMEPQ